jgi:beta-glucosidase
MKGFSTMRPIFRTVLSILVACSFVAGQSTSNIEAKIDSLLQKMTFAEKIGQLNQLSGRSARHEEMIRKGALGSLLNVIGAEETNQLQAIAIKESRLGIPLIFGLDVIHGYRTIFPIPLACAASWDTALIRQAAHIAAREARASGIHWTFSPMVDIARDARWGRIAEGAGEDPFLGAAVAQAYVRGYQGSSLANDDAVLACAKHYVAYGAAEGGRDYNTVDISERTLRDIYLPPFKAAVEAGAGTLMSAFNEIGGVPASANALTLRQILRGEWGFTGFVVSDWESILELMVHGIAATNLEAGLLALKAGVDMDMEGECYSVELQNYINQGLLSEDLINDAVRRILRYKYKLGLFDKPYTDPELSKKVILHPEHIKVARQMAQESIVLLKNDKSVLPLNLAQNKTIAIIGPLADDPRTPLGTWSCQGNADDVVTILDALKKRLTTSKLLFTKGCGIVDNNKKDFAKAVEIAQQADLVILVMGESADMSGEAASRTELTLPGVQNDLIKAVAATKRPIVLVLLNGRPLVLTEIEPYVQAIVETWQLGLQHGNAVVDILLGEVNPSGKLTATFPRAVGQIPIYYNHKNTGRPGNEFSKYTSKYLDQDNKPLYPFGWGLSYTTFKYSDLKVLKPQVGLTDNLSVSVTVKNTGKLAGTEIVQLYVRDLIGSVTRPVAELKGFQRLYLNAGESKQVTFTVPVSQLGFHDQNLRYVVEPGTFKVMVGGNSAELISTEFEVVAQ